MSFLDVRDENWADRGILLNCNNLEDMVDLRRNNSLPRNSPDNDKDMQIGCSLVDDIVHFVHTDSKNKDSDDKKKIRRNEALWRDEKQEDDQTREDISIER